MAGITLQEFLLNRSLLALKISSNNVGGYFKKTFVVPMNTAGLAFFSDGSSALVRGGEEVPGKFDLVLAKEGEVPMRIIFPDLRTADGLPLSATCTLSLAFLTGRPDLFRDFCRSLFTFPGTYSAADLKNHVGPEIRRVLGEYVAARAVTALHRADPRGAIHALLERTLERFLFDAGIEYRGLSELSLVSSEHEKRAVAEAKRIEEQHRAAAFMEKKEERLRRLANILKDQEVQGLLTKVPDEQLKGLLYAKLMEDDSIQITAEELVSKAKDCGEEVVQVIYKAMENLLSNGASVAADEIESSRADRIFLAAGNKVLEIDPAAEGDPTVYAFKDQLRSVRGAETPGGFQVIGGSRKSVHSITPAQGPDVLDYPLPGDRSIRGGVNSIAAAGDYLYATHSEYGLARWRAGKPGEPADLIFEEITRPHKTTRAVQAWDGRLIFASGHHVYVTTADAGKEPVKFVSSIESPVTCLAVAARTIFAGTENGSIVCWKIDSPDQPVVVVRKRDAIVNLRLARICAIPHLLYSTRDLAIRARVIGQNLETSYESNGAPVSVLDAASDLICASDADGRRVLLWKSTAPSRPHGEIDVWKTCAKPVLDIWMKKVRAKSA